MMLFDSTLRRELARNFGATLVVILTIVAFAFLVFTWVGVDVLGLHTGHGGNRSTATTATGRAL